jgi:hypothetical protein
LLALNAVISATDYIPARAVAPPLSVCRGRGLLLVDAIADVRVVLPRPGTGQTVVVGLLLPRVVA